MELVVLYGSHHIVVMRLGKAGFRHGIGSLRVTVKRKFFGLLSNWDSICAIHIRCSSRVVSEYVSQLILGKIIQTVHIDASTIRPLPVLILPFKTSLNDFIPDNHEFQVKIALVYIFPKFRFPEKFPICVKHS